MSVDILSSIAAYKRHEVVQRKTGISLASLESAANAAKSTRGFRRALEHASVPGRLALIAEIKKASPSKGLIRPDFNPPEIARAYEAGGAACLSVLTDAPSFQGYEQHLVEARAAVSLPCLRKDFIVDPWQVAESRMFGADAILVILAITDDSLARDLISEAGRWDMDVLVETHDEHEVERALTLGSNLLGINNRDLRTFVTDLSVTETLSKNIPPSVLIVTESGIFTAEDAHRLERAGASAMLVGESLMRQENVVAATRKLLGGGPPHA